jgi:hypothetical protein
VEGLPCDPEATLPVPPELRPLPDDPVVVGTVVAGAGTVTVVTEEAAVVAAVVLTDGELTVVVVPPSVARSLPESFDDVATAATIPPPSRSTITATSTFRDRAVNSLSATLFSILLASG